MSRPTQGLRGACWARSTASCRRSSTRWKIRLLSLLQSRERRLTRRLEKNQLRQLRVLTHPLYQEHQRKEILRLKELQQLEQPQFDLRHLL